MKTSRIKRLVPKKVARQYTSMKTDGAEGLKKLMEREGADVIEKMNRKGYRLVACLETGEGVFAREENVAGLHIQLPLGLYRKVDAMCRERGTTKRALVIAALETYFETTQPPGEDR